MMELIEIAPKVLGLKIDGKITEEDMKSMISVCEKRWRLRNGLLSTWKLLKWVESASAHWWKT